MGNPIRYFGYTDGRICDRLSNFQTITFPSSSNEVVVYYQTDGSNSQSNLRGFQGSFEARGEEMQTNIRTNIMVELILQILMNVGSVVVTTV